jgi:hypothetical protein
MTTISDEIITLLTNKLSYLRSLRNRAVEIGDITQIADIDNKIVEVSNLLQQLA